VGRIEDYRFLKCILDYKPMDIGRGGKTFEPEQPEGLCPEVIDDDDHDWLYLQFFPKSCF
jgi:hypothetical protein